MALRGGSLGPTPPFLLLCLASSLAPAAATYSGGSYEPCIDPSTPDICFDTRCIHLYTVPEQYHCYVETYPKYNYDPTGPQCARPICKCNPAYTGGACAPTHDNQCLQHKCSRRNATHYSPVRIHPFVETEITFFGDGLDSRRGADAVKFSLEATCLPPENVTWTNESLAAGTNFTIDLDPGDVDLLTMTTVIISPTEPGEYLVCYKETPLDWEEVKPKLIVAGAVAWSTNEEYNPDTVRLNDPNSRISFEGFGFTSDDIVKFVQYNESVFGYEHYLNGNTHINNTCEMNTTLPIATNFTIFNHTNAELTYPHFFDETNATVCYKASGGEWINLGAIQVASVPLAYIIDSSYPQRGKPVLRVDFNLTFIGSELGGQPYSSGDEVFVREQSRLFNDVLELIRWTKTPCTSSEDATWSGTLKHEGDFNYNAFGRIWSERTTFEIEGPTNKRNINATVCYYSRHVERFFEILPLTPEDNFFFRRLYYMNHDDNSYECIPDHVTVTQGQIGCVEVEPDALIYNLHSTQNASLEMAPLTALAMNFESHPKPDKIRMWIKPGCTNMPNLRLRALDVVGRKIFDLHLGCPYLTINHQVTKTDWASSEGTHRCTDPTNCWSQLVVQLFWDLDQFYVFWNGERVEVGEDNLHDFLDPAAFTVTDLHLENLDSPECSVEIDEFEMFHCFEPLCYGELDDQIGDGI